MPPKRPARAVAPSKGSLLPSVSIGIDFGTTYSGVSWARSGRPDHLYTVTNWASVLHQNTDKDKVPTAICYDEDGTVSSWGYNIPSSHTPIKWFKLLLVDEKDLQPRVVESEYMFTARSLLKKARKKVDDVVADYLKVLWQHSLSTIEKAIGHQMLELSQLNVVLTLPAIWPPYAQRRMRCAAEVAGILDVRVAGETTLSFISEPEAAAISTMADMSDRPDMGKHEHFLVCDAGGGTVDVITYTVTDAPRQNKALKVKESVKGDGDMCGAVFLDQGFIALLKEHLPRDIWDRLGETGLQRLMNTEWEHGVKPQFKNEETPWHIQIPFGGTVQNRFHPPEINFQRSQIFGIFEPVVARVARLVGDQIKEVKRKHRKTPKFIILVGGFGKSLFLHQHLERAMASASIEVLQGSGERPWTAVCRGAVLKGLAQGNSDIVMPISVDSRIARVSYGTTCNLIPWDAKEHQAKDREWCFVQQEFLAVNQTKWFVLIDVEHSAEVFESEFVYCEEPIPPSRCDATVKRLCKVKWSQVPNFNQLPKWTNTKGKAYRQVCYDVQMTYRSGSLEFAVVYDGRPVATHNVSVDFSDSGNTFRPEDADQPNSSP